MLETHEVLAAEDVAFISEWRCCICHGQVLKQYDDNWDMFRYLDTATIKSAIADCANAATAGNRIDFRVPTDGHTVVVEVKDGYPRGHSD